MGFFSWGKPTPVREHPKGREDCQHFWRAFPSTQIGYLTCEKCGKDSTEAFVELFDRAIILAQTVK